jgi:hypothetical protein
MEQVGGVGAQLTGDEEDGDIPSEAGLARRRSETEQVGKAGVHLAGDEEDDGGGGEISSNFGEGGSGEMGGVGGPRRLRRRRR